MFELLRSCKSINADAFTRIHKGHPYYFIGITSYLLDDFQTAIYFFDAAVTEDIYYGADPVDNPKPSTHFLMLEGEANYQSAKELTKFAQTKVERALEYYTKLTSNSEILELTLDDLRKEFIYYALMATDKPGLRTLVTAFITYFIEWDFRNDHFECEVKKGTSEPFFLHLFRGCILFESLMKLNPVISPKSKTIGGILQEPKIISKLKIKSIQGKKDGFVLEDIFDKSQRYDNSIDQAIQISYMARNTLGHSLGWDANINQSQYRELYLIIGASCLHVIACLWRKT
jgi:tetratricopeptide (TPR) repeat protein